MFLTFSSKRAANLIRGCTDMLSTNTYSTQVCDSDCFLKSYFGHYIFYPYQYINCISDVGLDAFNVMCLLFVFGIFSCFLFYGPKSLK